MSELKFSVGRRGWEVTGTMSELPRTNGQTHGDRYRGKPTNISARAALRKTIKSNVRKDPSLSWQDKRHV